VTQVAFSISGDEISKSLITYTETESLNHTYKIGITKFAENLSAVQDYRQAEVRTMLYDTMYIKQKIIHGLKSYMFKCLLCKMSNK
jgi:hypothetical protein